MAESSPCQRRRKLTVLRAGDHVGQFRVLRRLAGGGNADVYEADSDNGRIALKVLRSRNGRSEPYRRFRTEAAKHKQLSDAGVRGVLPLLDFDVPEDPNDHRPPLARYLEIIRGDAAT